MSDAHDTVHTLADLDAWSFRGTSLAVIGHPIAHSLSPAMHNAALAELAQRDTRFASWRYFKFDIDPAELSRALTLFADKGFVGVNLTIPHKIIAVDLVHRIDPAAADAEAVNTLRLMANVRYEGFNTDGHGVTAGIAEDLGRTIEASPIVLLGAGGAARAAAITCLHGGCASLWIGNRSQTNLRALIDQLAPTAHRMGIPLHGFDLAHPPRDIPPDAIVINATASGLKPGEPPPIDVGKLPGRPCIYDMVYNPPVTPLIQAARDIGLSAANGLTMLVHQGARALEIWTEQSVRTDIMLAACRDALAGASAVKSA
ncbi:MAG: shikimate dehydrogenase [Opitutaceae bacterium]|nr:shikimate dehydrogenase [Opitutaceae bacterium]